MNTFIHYILNSMTLFFSSIHHLVKITYGAKAIYISKIVDNVDNPKVWMAMSAISLFISQYVFSQWAFAIGFSIIFTMDTISGTYIAYRTGLFNGKTFRDKLMDKSLAYFTIIVAFSVGTKMMLEDSDVNLIQYLNLPFYSLFMAVELRSIVFSWYEFKKWAWLGKLLEMFDSSQKKKIDEIENGN